MRIIKTNDWYDPEGLNIPNDRVELIYEGSYTECVEKLKTIRLNKIAEFSNRKDIKVGEIRTKMKVLSQIPGRFGGYTVIREPLPQSEYFEIYYMSAISKEYYSIVE